jgi:hypothetical protein
LIKTLGFEVPDKRILKHVIDHLLKAKERNDDDSNQNPKSNKTRLKSFI